MVGMYQPHNCCSARGISHLGGPVPAHESGGTALVGGDHDPETMIRMMNQQLDSMEGGGSTGRMPAMGIVEAFTVSSQTQAEALLERIGFTRVFGPIPKDRYPAADLSLWAITGTDFYNGVKRVLRQMEDEKKRKAELARLKKEQEEAPKEYLKAKAKRGEPKPKAETGVKRRGLKPKATKSPRLSW